MGQFTIYSCVLLPECSILLEDEFRSVLACFSQITFTPSAKQLARIGDALSACDAASSKALSVTLKAR
jgi:hypothetical protein